MSTADPCPDPSPTSIDSCSCSSPSCSPSPPLSVFPSIVAPFFYSSCECSGIPVLIIDGGMGTLIESGGHSISTPLWSAQLLSNQQGQEIIRQIHRQYLEAGADLILTSSYQASRDGLIRHQHISTQEANTLLSLSSTLAVETRDQFWSHSSSSSLPSSSFSSPSPSASPSPSPSPPPSHLSRCRPLVAASCGCYGATLGNGSEYTVKGYEGVSEEELERMHRERVEIVAGVEGVDLVAFETIPTRKEIQPILNSMRGINTPSSSNPSSSFSSSSSPSSPSPMPFFVSFACCSSSQLNDGSFFSSAVEFVVRRSYEMGLNLIAVGVNCTAPRFVSELLKEGEEAIQRVDRERRNAAEAAKAGAGGDDHDTEEKSIVDTGPTNRVDLPFLLCYPNSGEEWDAATHTWKENETEKERYKQREANIKLELQRAREAIAPSSSVSSTQTSSASSPSSPLSPSSSSPFSFSPAPPPPSHPYINWQRDVLDWYASGARMIGGCCRTTPAHIRAIRDILMQPNQEGE